MVGVLGVLAAAVVLPIAQAGGARADDGGLLVDGTLYFSPDPGANCSITPDGRVGCDLDSPVFLYYGLGGIPSVRQVYLDVSGSARPGFNLLPSNTVPGGNPPMPRASVISHAGITCYTEQGFTFRCTGASWTDRAGDTHTPSFSGGLASRGVYYAG
ncbi:hypothetical protein JMUB6875_31560 [Nocardia sp. JMUB6875]